MQEEENFSGFKKWLLFRNSMILQDPRKISYIKSIKINVNRKAARLTTEPRTKIPKYKNF